MPCLGVMFIKNANPTMTGPPLHPRMVWFVCLPHRRRIAARKPDEIDPPTGGVWRPPFSRFFFFSAKSMPTFCAMVVHPGPKLEKC